MGSKLIAEEGTAAGTTFTLEAQEEWVLGRDPDEATLVVADPRVSRQHLIIRKTSYGYLAENLSTTNPALLNGTEMKEPHVFEQGDRLQVGETVFRYATTDEATPAVEEGTDEEEPYETLFGDVGPLPEGPRIDLEEKERYVLKVVSGPNSGAELGLSPGHSYVIGTDTGSCDIVFHDLSVSRQHARLTLTEEEELTVEDLNSRNGVIVDGKPIDQPESLQGNSVVSLGTTSFLIIDHEGVQQTLIAPSFGPTEPERKKEAAETEPAPQPPPTEDVVYQPEKKSVLSGGSFILVLAAIALVIVLVAGVVSLFETEDVAQVPKDYNKELKQTLADYTEVRYNFNPQTGDLFILGHVLTPVDKSELMYDLRKLPFVTAIDDNIVVDKYVWEEANELLSKNAEWTGVSLHSPKPGTFVLAGYLKTAKQLDSLQDYMAINFSYLDRLENQVVVEQILLSKIISVLQSDGLGSVIPALYNGELTLTGSISVDDEEKFTATVDEIRTLKGVRLVKDAVTVVKADRSFVDLSGEYSVQGFSRQDGAPVTVLIDGQIVAIGDTFRGMDVVEITPKSVLLEKDGIRYRINYSSR